jgi:hypothetical protein
MAADRGVAFAGCQWKPSNLKTEANILCGEAKIAGAHKLTGGKNLRWPAAIHKLPPITRFLCPLGQRKASWL